MKNRIYILILLIASLSVSICAQDFQKARELLSENLGERLASVDIFSILTEERAFTDKNGNEFFVFGKEVNGIPVYGENKLVVLPKNRDFTHFQAMNQFNDEEVHFLQNVQSLESREDVQIELEEAFTIAIQDLRKSGEFLSQDLPADMREQANLVYYQDYQGEYRLVYHMVLPGQLHQIPTRFQYAISALDGSVVDKYGELYSLEGKGIDLTHGHVHHFAVEKDGDKFKMRDAQRKISIFDSEEDVYSVDEDGNWDDEGVDRKSNQRAEVELFVNMAKAVDYFNHFHQFQWKNGKRDIKALAHYKENLNNAFFSAWKGLLYFGDGSGKKGGFDYMVKGLDVVAHEFTHGVISQLSPLAYSGDSGAMNEHISDFFGAMVDNDDWLLGDNVAIQNDRPTRNMQDPTRGYAHLITPGMKFIPWTKLRKQHNLPAPIYPDRMSKKIICGDFGQDNGGVHINSSILNKFAYLATTGKEISRDGLGRKLMADIYMRMLRSNTLSVRAKFPEFKEKLTAFAAIELENHPEGEKHMETLAKAFDWIEL